MRDRVLEVLSSAIADLNASWANPALERVDEDTRLFGPGGNVDSLGLVSLITEVETRIYDEFQVDVVLADERAMSQKVSPFRNVRALASHVEKLLSEARA